MFVVTQLKDTITVDPSFFGVEQQKALALQIEAKYGNKVLPGVGLCVCLYDIVRIGDSRIYAGDGSAHTNVVFRLVVFAPEEEEVLEGTITASDEEGIDVSLGFFNDVRIPADLFPTPCEYVAEEHESVWTWFFKPEGEEEAQKLMLDRDAKIRFKVHSVVYKRSGTRENAYSEEDADGSGRAAAADSSVPMSIVGSIAGGDGLGVTMWWDYAEEEDDGEGGEEIDE